ncbi:MAG: pentapeptide repeat-containing protein [Bacteroidia bacterium]|nr:pentapeptide repeat-containing protein [Bacteroidia bacterium]
MQTLNSLTEGDFPSLNSDNLEMYYDFAAKHEILLYAGIEETFFVGLKVESDSAQKLIRYVLIGMTKSQFSDFCSGKTSLKEILAQEMNSKISLLDLDEKKEVFQRYICNRDDVPFFYLYTIWSFEISSTHDSQPEGISKKKKISSDVIAAFFVALTLGILAGILFMSRVIVYLGSHMPLLIAGGITLMVIISVILFLFFAFKEWFFQRIFRVGKASLEDIVKPASNFLISVFEKGPLKKDEGIDAIHKAVVWYSSSKTRRSILAFVLSLLVSLGGLITTVYLYQQTELMNEQTELIKKQNFLSESDRRAALISELSAIFDKIESSYADCYNQQGGSRLQESTKGRIIAVSNSFKPYRYLDESGELIDIFTSPERGQLITVLSNVLKEDDFYSFMGKVNFEYADLSGSFWENRMLRGLKMSKANFRNSKIKGTDFSLSELNRARFENSTIQETKFENISNFFAPFFSGKILKDVTFSFSVLDSASFSDDTLRGVLLKNSSFQGAHFQNVVFDSLRKNISPFEIQTIYCDFSASDLRKATFQNCDLSSCYFLGADLRGTVFWECELPESSYFKGAIVDKSQLLQLSALGVDTSQIVGIN